ncbi:MAG: hypothetical protein ACO1TH_22620, partial [Luteitalea sp.]
MNEDKGTRYRRAERTLRLVEVTAGTVVLGVLALSPVPTGLRTWSTGLLDTPASPAGAFVRHAVVAALLLTTSLALPALAAAPFALRRLYTLARRYLVPFTTPR